jgi:hypothetical protein
VRKALKRLRESIGGKSQSLTQRQGGGTVVESGAGDVHQSVES